MTRSHFADYAKRHPKDYEAFANSMWNGFVSVTKYIPVMGRFFSFTPELLNEIDVDRATDLGSAMGEVYALSEGMIDYTITNDHK